MLLAALSPTVCDLTDFSDGPDGPIKIEAYIVSEAFEGKAPVARQRLVYTALGPLMERIHALTFKKTITPAEHAKLQAK